MTTVNINGYDVKFPYPTPYDIQKKYMEKVLTCLDQKTHAVLESPTGTGKTLCLFAPVTTWAKNKKLQNIHYVTNDTPIFNSNYFEKSDQQGKWGDKTRAKIWYTARTHSQIAQTVSEVRKCDTEGLNVRVMGARDQLCVNAAVKEEKDSYIKTIKCKELVKNKGCKYYTKLTYEKDLNKFYSRGEVLDIEDLTAVGRNCGICPYFLAKKASETADIVLLPYNYIIDKESRESNGLYLQNDVIIFDEGHNVPSSCEENYEFTFSSLDIAIGIKNLKELMASVNSLAESSLEDNEIDVALHVSNSTFLMSVLKKLELEFEKLEMSKDLLPVSSLYNFFTQVGINEQTSRQVVDGIQAFKNDATQLAISGSTLETFKLLEKVMNVIFGPVVKSFDQSVIETSFKYAVDSDSERHNVKKLSLFCFNPSFGIKSLLQLGVQSIIITSGTLSPLRTFISELGLPNPITLVNGHIAKKSQVPFMIVGTGVNNERMNGSFKNREVPAYVSSLGMTLTNLISSVPDGVLLLFSSFGVMNKLKETWEANLGIWARLNSLKRVFIEPRDKDDFITVMENYKRAIDAGNGAILMGVLRAKISEGMDFKDQYCRAVFIVGVPFPPIKELRVQGKEKYAESLTIYNPVTKTNEKLYTNSFMAIEAMKATNQAIGRVIRHGSDYGAIFLVDHRFASVRLFYNISAWLRGDSPSEVNFPTAKKFVREFFKNIHLGKLGVEEIRIQRVDSNGCPIASYVSYEEYDHKKHAAQPVSWIGGSLENSKSQQSSKPRGHSKIEYVDVDQEDILSVYKKKYSTEVFQSESKSNDCNNSGSLLGFLESSRSSSVGYREFDKNSFKSSPNKNKRKFKDDENDTENSNSKCSPSMLCYPETIQIKIEKKPLRLKVRPFTSFDSETTTQDNTNKSEMKKMVETKENEVEKTNDNEGLKVKLINYFKTVKQSFPEENGQRFKDASCRYMRGELDLSNVVELMDELFIKTGNKNLFSGFVHCLKKKDKEHWMDICKRRKITLQQE